MGVNVCRGGRDNRKEATMQSVIEEFQRVIDTAYDQLLQFDEATSAEPLAPGKWSRKELLGHLIDSASNNHQRFIRGQLDESHAFPGYEQNGWVERNGYRDRSWHDLVMLWRSYNRHLLHVVARLPEDQLNTVCTIGNNEPVTLGFIAEDYVAHMQHHLEQLFAE
jgi:hypothetical protein